MEETFHLRNLTVFHDEQLLLVEGGSQELVSHGGDGRLRGPETQELVQVEAESEDHGQDDGEQDEEDLEFREPEPLEEIAQDQGEDADEREDREDDPEDAHAQVPAVQPLRGSDLLTLGHVGTSTTTSRGEGYFPRSVGTRGTFGWGTASLLLHVARALELDRLFAGAVHLRDQVDGVLQVPVVRGDPPQAEHDEGDRDRQGERSTGDGAGGPLDRILNSRHEDEEPDRDADDQEHRPPNRQGDPPSDAGLRAERQGHAFPSRRRASG